MGRARISNLWGIALIVIVGCSLSAQGKYGGGSGTPEDPYQIWDANHMQAIGANPHDWNKHFKLMADIDLSGFTGTAFNIIGHFVDRYSPDNKPFTGVFDGNGKTIYNFNYSSTDEDCIGLFRCVGQLSPVMKTGDIIDLGLVDPNVDGGTGDCVGSLVGIIDAGTITGCYVDGGSISGTGWSIGGLAGENFGTITDCYSISTVVTGRWEVGGLVGGNYGAMSCCYSATNVLGMTDVGGLVGYNGVRLAAVYIAVGTITNCYSEGDVLGDYGVGGLVGWNDGLWDGGRITNCYSTSSVSGAVWDIGGLAGGNEGEVIGSFWDIEASGQTSSAGGTGKTTAEMKMKNTFTNAGWGCELVWIIDSENDYPRLWWENKPGEAIPTTFYGGGSGDPNEPYLIYTAEQLNTIGLVWCDWDKHFQLMADVDLSEYVGKEFNIIGNSGDNPFTGVFDGNGHTISNFSYTSTDRGKIGLFGYVSDPNAVIKDLGLINPNIDAGTGSHVGSLVGPLSNEGTIINCYLEGGSVSGGNYVGGLVGLNDGIITNSYASGSVLGDNEVGGMVGYNSSGTITNCYSEGDVSGDYVVGGLAGRNYSGTINNCYSAGSVDGNVFAGGLVGRNDYGAEVTGSFWDIETSCQATSAGGTGKTTTEMHIKSTFTSAGWDFTTPIWKMNCEGMSYPKLSWWQPVLGDFLCPDGVNFFDFSFFAGHWQEDNCGASNDCDGTDLNLLGKVEINDLRIFVDNWLRGF